MIAGCLAITAFWPVLAVAQQSEGASERSEEAGTATVSARDGNAAWGGAAHHVRESTLRRFDDADPDRVFTGLPGVYVRSEEGYGLRPNIGMRGANSHRSRRVTLLEDGVLQAYAPYSSPSIFSMTAMTRVVGVDVYTGPTAILYGPLTIGGAIDLRTRDVPEGTSASFDYGYGSYGTSRLHFFAGTSNRRFGALVEGLQMSARGFQRIDFTGGSNGFELGDYALRAFWRETFGAVRHRLSAKLVVQSERSDESYLGLTDADFAADAYRRYVASSLDEFTRGRTQVELREQLDVGASLRITAVAYRSDVARAWYRLDRFRSGPSINAVLMNPTSAANAPYLALLRGDAETPDAAHALVYVNNDWRYVSQGVQLDARWTRRHDRWSHDLRAGLRLHNDSIDRHIGADGYSVLAHRLVPDLTPRASQNEDLAETTALSGYVHYALGYGSITFAPGVRVEEMWMTFTDRIAGRETSTPLTAIAPGASLVVDASEHARFFAGAHRGFTPPLPQDAATTSLETSWNYELGARLATAHNASASAAAFFSDYDNITSQCTLTAGCTDIDHAYNGGRAWVWGAELAGSYTFRAGRFDVPVQLAWTYTGSSFREGFASADPQLGTVHEGDSLPYVPAHQGSASVGVELPQRGAIFVRAAYVGEMREEASQGDLGRRTDAQVMLDASAQIRLLDHVTLTARAENLLQQEAIVSRRPWGARPLKPFQAFAGLRIDL